MTWSSVTNCWFGKNPSAENLMENPAVMENQELSTGTGMEATHRPRPNQDVGCGHSESNPVESLVCDVNTATKVHRVSSYTEFSFSSSSSDDKFKNQKSPQSSSAGNNSEKSAGYTKGGFHVMAETTRNHIFSKEISQVIIAAMVLAPNFY